jgi:cyanophycinase
LCLATGCAGRAAIESVPAGTVVGPPNGALVLAGGGVLGDEIIGRFIELAGGPDAPIVLIPTAAAEDTGSQEADMGVALLRAAGARRVTVLHAEDRARADTEEFVRPLQEARGLWFLGGRQWRLVDSYLHTRAHREMYALLDRGGVIGGSSAGASIQASFLIRGAREGNHIIVAPDYMEGFGFLRNVAVDQHLLTRDRQEDLIGVVAAHPQLLGIGLDEGTAIVVRGDVFDVIGTSKVAVYQAHGNGRAVEASSFFLGPGARYDMRRRRALD